MTCQVERRKTPGAIIYDSQALEYELVFEGRTSSRTEEIKTTSRFRGYFVVLKKGRNLRFYPERITKGNEGVYIAVSVGCEMINCQFVGRSKSPEEAVRGEAKTAL